MTINNAQRLREQYRDSSNLGARMNLHARFATDPVPWQEWVFERIEGGRVLEIGCGPGWLWRANVARVPDDWRIAATDMSPGMVAELRQHLPRDVRFTFAVTDAQALPYRDAAFDVIVANHMLYHVPDVDRALAEFSRVLRPRGQLIAATNGPGHMPELRQLIADTGRPWPRWWYLEAFGLETGPPMVERHFDDVVVQGRPGTLAVTDPDAVVDYLRSMSGRREPKGKVAEAIRQRVSDAIRREGSFKISTDAGLVLARKRHGS